MKIIEITIQFEKTDDIMVLLEKFLAELDKNRYVCTDRVPYYYNLIAEDIMKMLRHNMILVDRKKMIEEEKT